MLSKTEICFQSNMKQFSISYLFILSTIIFDRPNKPLSSTNVICQENGYVSENAELLALSINREAILFYTDQNSPRL